MVGKKLEVPPDLLDNNCMMNKKEYITYGDKKLDGMVKAQEHANLVLEIRDRVADISKDEDFEMNLNLFLDCLAEDVMDARWD